AFFPSSYFTYLEPGVMSSDRLEGVMRLTPALGQQKIYVLVFTTPQDLQQTTKLIDPAKAYAKGTGNAVPDIPDPIAKHVTDGTISLKVKTSTGSSVLVGPLFGSSGNGPVTVGNTAAPVAAPAPAPAAKSEPMLDDTETYFNNGIKQAVAKGDIDKALKLMNEAERLGSKSARSTFISSVKGKG
ncbi:MAG: maltose operon protein MalM, partial [Pantoea sp.]|nr:maltose operon protein MalM [Pantoea sp.]